MDEEIYKHWNHSWAESFTIHKAENGDIIFSVKRDFHRLSFAVNPVELPKIIGVLKKEVKELEFLDGDLLTKDEIITRLRNGKVFLVADDNSLILDDSFELDELEEIVRLLKLLKETE